MSGHWKCSYKYIMRINMSFGCIKRENSIRKPLQNKSNHKIVTHEPSLYFIPLRILHTNVTRPSAVTRIQPPGKGVVYSECWQVHCQHAISKRYEIFPDIYHESRRNLWGLDSTTAGAVTLWASVGGGRLSSLRPQLKEGSQKQLVGKGYDSRFLWTLKK